MNNANSNNRPSDKETARAILQFVRRNRWLVVGVPVATLIMTAFFIAWTTPVYMGETVIRVDKERSNIAVLDALQELSNGASIYTEMAELRSRSVAEDVVDSLDLHLNVITPRRDPRSTLFSAMLVERNARPDNYTLTSIGGGRYRLTSTKSAARDVAIGTPFAIPGAMLMLAPTARRHNTIRFNVVPFQVAVGGLQDGISVRRPDREADMVEISYEHTDRELAEAIPNTTARLFIQRRQSVKTQQARSTVAFLHDQLDTLGQQLHGFETGLQQFREGQGVVSLEAEGEAQVSRLADFQANRDIAEAERTALAKLMDDISRTPVRPNAANEPSPYRRLVGFPTILSNAAAGEVLRSLNDMENQRAELLTKRTPLDPDVIILTNRIHEMEDQLQSLVATYLQGLTNRIASLDGVLAQFATDLKRIPAKEIQLARLKRQAKITEDIYTTLQSRMKEAQIASAILDPSVRVVDPAIEPLKPISPNKPLDIVLALILGIALGGGIAFVRENLDTTIHTREELQVETGAVPVLGLIPRIRDTVAATNGARRPIWRIRTRPAVASPELIRARLVAGRNPRGSASEAYRALRTNLAFSQPEKAPRTIVFTSAAPGDGKSTSSSNLAITLAQQGLRSILIDADMRRGAMHVAFETSERPGLSDYLLGGLSLEEIIRRVKLDDVGLDFIPRGTIPPNPAELLATTRMQALLEHLEGEYDTVIFDAPPLNVVTDAAVLGARTDGVLVVVRAGVTDRSALRFALHQLSAVRARVLGCVLNDIDEKRERYYGSELAGSYYEVKT